MSKLRLQDRTRIVRKTEHVIDCFERRSDQNRAKHLVLHDLTVWRAIGENRRLIKIAVRIAANRGARSSALERSAASTAPRKMWEILVSCAAVAIGRPGYWRQAHYPAGFDQHARQASRYNLRGAAVEHRAGCLRCIAALLLRRCPRHTSERLFDIGIGENDIGTFPAKLESSSDRSTSCSCSNRRPAASPPVKLILHTNGWSTSACPAVRGVAELRLMAIVTSGARRISRRSAFVAISLRRSWHWR